MMCRLYEVSAKTEHQADRQDGRHNNHHADRRFPGLYEWTWEYGSQQAKQGNLHAGAPHVRWQSDAFPRGAALLDHLYHSLALSFTDTAATQLLQRLFLASLRPFAAQICTSLHEGLDLVCPRYAVLQKHSDIHVTSIVQSACQL